eukprot:TRINITY_DN1460_c0_g1_i1.p1 TRINITY_DN1460_c0_g1~~TRINITY_DN1460_c0_g1_i1.p1  ORF type:complete len:419 (-),score=127.59 TRINITY_DN1460_c0_g1_i1:235-1491(-)
MSKKNKNKKSSRPETNLVQLNIGSAKDGPRLFGTKTASGGTPIVLIPIRKNPFKITVPEGCHAIMSCRGASVGIYKPGSYVLPPWYQISYLVTSHHIPYHFSVKECPTSDNVLITLEVDFLLHITDPEEFVFSIGPENMEELLRATQAETVRGLVRGVNVDDAYDLRGVDSDEMLDTLNDKMNKYGVNVDQVTIANVTLPDDIAISMQTETTFYSRQRQREKTQEYEMQCAGNVNERKKLNLECQNLRLQVNEEAKKDYIFLQQEIKEMEVKMDKILAEIKADEYATVQNVKAQNEKEVSHKNNEKQIMLTEIQTQASIDSQQIQAETDRDIIEIQAETNVVIASNHAKALKIKAEAEKQVTKDLQSKRVFELKKQKMDIYSNLANNDQVIISGKTGDHIMQMMVVREAAKNFKNSFN